MASKSLNFDLYGRDRTASSTMNRVGGTATRTGERIARAGRVAAAGLAIAAAALVAFGATSVHSAVEAETAQNKLTFAYEQFPQLANGNIEALRDLNTALARKTKYDDDATAAAQANLAQYRLSEAQIKRLTPLLQDYASRTGKDLVDASNDLGKAILGQGRALKAIGLDFVDTGNEAANFEQLVAGLRTQVGGFAEREGTTAAGRLEILQNRFGEVQEKVGVALLPALERLADTFETDLMPILEGGANWLAETGIPTFGEFASFIGDNGPLVIAIGAAAAAMWGLNAAMLANPVGWVVAAIGAQIAIFAVFWNVLTNGTGNAGIAFQNLGNIVSFVMNNGVIAPINAGIDVINGLLAAIQRLTGVNLGQIARLGYMGYNVTTGIEYRGAGGPGAPAAGKGPKATPFAEGGIAMPRPGGLYANIAEAGVPEAVVPLTERNMAAMFGGRGGGGLSVAVYVNGSYFGTKADLARAVTSAVKDAIKQGIIPRNSFG